MENNFRVQVTIIEKEKNLMCILGFQLSELKCMVWFLFARCLYWIWIRQQ